jgi:hypothetical protein
VASLTVLAVTGLCGLVLGLDVALGVVLAGTVLAGLVVGLASDRLVVTALAGGAVVLAGPLVASIVASPLSVLLTSPLVGLVGLVLTVTGVGAVFAAVLVGTPIPGDGRVARATRRLLVGVGLVLAALAAGALAGSVPVLNPLALLWQAVEIVVFDWLVDTADATALVTFAVVWALGLGSTALVLGRLPVVGLVPPDRRGPVRDRLSRMRRILFAVTAVGVCPALLSLGILLATAGTTRRSALAEAIHPAVDALATPIVTASVLRLLLLSLCLVSLLAVCGYRVGTWLRGQSRRRLILTAVPGSTTFAGAIAVGLVVEFTGLDERLIASLPADTADRLDPFVQAGGTLLWLALLVLALVAVFVLLLTLVLAVRYGVLPAHAAGNALASQGIFAGSLAVGIVDRPVLAVVGATLAMIVWDVGTVSRTLDRTLPAAADSTRFELVRLGGSAVIGVVAVLVALAVGAVAESGTLSPQSQGLSMLLLLLGIGTTIGAVFALRG